MASTKPARALPRRRPGRPPTAGVLASGALVLAGAVGLAAPAAAQSGDRGNDRVFESEHHAFRLATVAEGLKDPWSIAFLPGGDILITEKPGRLRIVRDGTLDPDPIPGTPEVRYRGQGGLLEVALHPDFADNRILYLSYSKPRNGGEEGTTALARARFDGERLVDVEEIFVAEAWSDGGAHFGGKIAFHPDGRLFLSVGDRGANPLQDPRSGHPAQDLSNHQGTLLRLNDDGTVPEDNPFVGREGALPEIWSYGHRNIQGLAIDQETGDVWATEHGPQGGDELNLVLPGRNYGWPVIGYGVQYGGTPIHASRHREGMEQPLQHWTPSIGVSGLVLYTGDRFPEWNGDLFVGGLAGQRMDRVALEREEGEIRVAGMERPPLLYGFGRIRDIRQGPDGLLYLAIDNRRGGGLTPVVRLEPVEEGEAAGR